MTKPIDTNISEISPARLCFDLLQETVSHVSDDNIPRLGAALAFYLLLSLIPMLALLASVATSLYGTESAHDQVYQFLLKFAGQQQAETILGLFDAAAQHVSVSSKSAYFNLIILAYGASSFFAQLQDAFNIIWKVPPYKGVTLLHILKERLSSFVMVFVIGLIMVLCILGNTALSVLINYTVSLVPAFAVLVQTLNIFLNFCVLACMFALTFKFVPDRKIAWSDVRVGSALTAFLFTAGQYVISFYLGHASFIAGYGTAGPIVALLIWIYYSVQIFFFGAEFTHVYAHHLGSCRNEDAKPAA